MKRADFHIHSTASDGTFSPTQIVAIAKESNLDYIALTDHNTINGFDEFKKECEKQGVFGITGIEFSVEFEEKEIHLLGYFKNLSQESKENIQNLLDENTKFVSKRIHDMIEKLSNAGFGITYQDLLDNLPTPDTIINRVYVAKTMVNKGYAKTIDEVFDNYIGKSAPYYTRRQYQNIQDVIDLIHQVGGIAVIAHPIQYKMSEDVLDRLFSLSVDGIEVYHSDHDENYSNFLLERINYIKKTKDRNLCYTIGSDFHGNNKPSVKMGQVSNHPIDEAFLELYKNL